MHNAGWPLIVLDMEASTPQESIDTGHQGLNDLLERLSEAVEAIVRTHPQGLSELALLRTLQQPPWHVLGDIDFNTPSALYPVHFLLFHTLYRWRNELVGSGRETLEINALSIRLRPLVSADETQPDRADPLQAFYLDLSNHDLSADTIDRMLDDFWKGIRRPLESELSAACGLLDIECPPPDLDAAQRQFRRLAMAHHPDRGGSTETLQDLNHAIATIKDHFRGTP